MGFFDKKVCSVCGGDAGRIFTKKLEDGVLCKECTGKLSPWFSDRRSSTVEQIKEQLAYREANKAEVAAFEPTHTFGTGTKIYIDADARKFLVTGASNWKNANPDVVDLTKVTGVNFEARESKVEDTFTNSEGETCSYNPPRYFISFNYYVTIMVNHPYFDDMTVKLNGSDVDGHDHQGQEQFQRMGAEIKEALTQARNDARESVAAANAPVAPTVCPACGATTTPVNGCCEYCGSAVSR